MSLDFGDLLDVNSLDDVLRETFRLMAKDVERAVRAWLVSEAAGRGEDGYGIVADFVSSLPRGFREGLRRDLVSRSQADEYAGSLIDTTGMPCLYGCCWKWYRSGRCSLFTSFALSAGTRREGGKFTTLLRM